MQMVWNGILLVKCVVIIIIWVIQKKMMLKLVMSIDDGRKCFSLGVLFGQLSDENGMSVDENYVLSMFLLCLSVFV